MYMPRCAKGTRRNKKTGECESAAARTAASNRCPKGTRRNKKTGECVSKTGSKKSMGILPKSLSATKMSTDEIHEFTFRIDAENVKTGEVLNISTPEQAKKIARWFLKFAKEDGEYSHITMEPKQYQTSPARYGLLCRFKLAEDHSGMEINTFKEILMNPDEDGNHPMKIENKKYMLLGREIK
jgi:hypothetical protein